MFQRILPYVLVVVAVVLAGGASATAARLITGKQIRAKAISTKHLATEAVTVSKTHQSVFDEAVLQAKQEIPAGPAGPAGPQGPAGQNSMFVVSSPVNFACAAANDGNPCEVASAKVDCPAGSGLTGGGHSGSVAMTTAESSPSGNGWLVIIVNENEFGSSEVQAHAVCSRGAAPTARSTARRGRDGGDRAATMRDRRRAAEAAAR